MSRVKSKFTNFDILEIAELFYRGRRRSTEEVANRYIAYFEIWAIRPVDTFQGSFYSVYDHVSFAVVLWDTAYKCVNLGPDRDPVPRIGLERLCKIVFEQADAEAV